MSELPWIFIVIGILFGGLNARMAYLGRDRGYNRTLEVVGSIAGVVTLVCGILLLVTD